MTVMTETAAHEHADAPGVCWRCGGPCLTHKGTVHGWTCTKCLDRYLDEAAAKGAARDRKERDRLQRKMLRNETQTSVTANGDRRRGGVTELCTGPASASIEQEEAADRDMFRAASDHDN